jgi:hypothetical protein
VPMGHAHVVARDLVWLGPVEFHRLSHLVRRRVPEHTMVESGGGSTCEARVPECAMAERRGTTARAPMRIWDVVIAHGGGGTWS